MKSLLRQGWKASLVRGFQASLVLLCWGAAESVALGAETAGRSPLLGGWLGGIFSGLNNRTRIVQFCVVTMCLALFIIMKKFTSTGSSGVVGPAKRMESTSHRDSTPPNSPSTSVP